MPTSPGGAERLPLRPGGASPRPALVSLKEELFLQAVDEVRRRRPDAEAGAGLRGVKLLDWADSTLHLAIPHEFSRGLFERAVRAPLEAAMLALTGSSVRVRLHVAAGESRTPRPERRARRARPSSLADFVLDENNRLAFGLVTQYRKGSPLFDPLLVYGPAACGKTHLLRGFVEQFRQDRVAENAAYFTATIFGRAFRATAYRRRLEAFRAEVDRPRILVIDELDRLATMPATQRELVRVLERRQARGNATLFAAREHPGRLAGLEEALRTRLLGGMVAQMKPPHPATVLARVKARLAKRGIRTETGVLARAVELGGGHPVAAETIVLEAAVAARSKGRPLVADQLVSPPRPEAADGPGSSRIDRLTARVSTYFAVSAADLRSPRKVRRALEPRRFLALLLRRAAGLRSAEIGCYLGGRSVSTVTALLRQGAALLERDPALREFFEQLHPSNDVDPSVRS